MHSCIVTQTYFCNICNPKVGGVFNLWSTNISIFGVVFENVSALDDGGAIYSDNSCLVLRYTQFLRCTSKKHINNFGGNAIFNTNSILYLVNESAFATCYYLENKPGDSVVICESSDFLIERMNMTNNLNGDDEVQGCISSDLINTTDISIKYKFTNLASNSGRRAIGIYYAKVSQINIVNNTISVLTDSREITFESCFTYGNRNKDGKIPGQKELPPDIIIFENCWGDLNEIEKKNSFIDLKIIPFSYRNCTYHCDSKIVMPFGLGIYSILTIFCDKSTIFWCSFYNDRKKCQ